MDYADRICAQLRSAGPLDGVLLALHGALVTPTRLDPDREMAERVRAVVGCDGPVSAALDYHGNIDAHLLELVDTAFGYHYSPHTDIAATGGRAANCLIRMMHDGVRPFMALAKPGVMVPSIFSATGLAPLSDIVRASVDMARPAPGFLDVSVFAGFSYADVPNCGFSVLAVADDPAEARQVADGLSHRIFSERERLLHRDLVLDMATGVDHAVARAARKPGRPVVLLEHADRCMAAVLDVQGLMVSLVSRPTLTVDEDPFVQFGMRAQDFGIVVLQSKTRRHPGWGTSRSHDPSRGLLNRLSCRM